MKHQYDFEEDPRYKIGLKQALIVAAIYVLYCLGAIAIAFPLTIFRPETKPMTFVAGFPDWVFWSIIVWPIFIVALLVWVVATKFEQVDLGPLDRPDFGKGARS
ncbi:MAG TPA: YhdT family protein [Firmicutes bacterium]|nr:YhdT family protein [Candidatus Fermentithermobacillaceae bacterium]